MTTSRRLRQTSFVDGSPEQRLWLTPTTAIVFSGKRDVVLTQGMGDRYVKNKGGGNLLEQTASVLFTEGGFSPPATPASRSATPGSGPERMTPGTSGLRFVDSLPDFRTTDRIGWFSRTFVATSAWGSTVCSLTWTTSATPAGRSLYLLRASARSTAGTGCGSSDAARMWMTPKAGDADFATPRTSGRPPEMSTHLATQVIFSPPPMWPTPTVQDGKNDAGPSQWERNSDPLNVAVQRVGMYPTPHASCSTGAGSEGRDGGLNLQTAVSTTGQKLNPDFVSRLMGYPDGWTVISDSDPA